MMVLLLLVFFVCFLLSVLFFNVDDNEWRERRKGICIQEEMRKNGMNNF